MSDTIAATRRGMKSFALGNVVSQAAALLRYMLLARLLGPTELGLAATLILTAQFFEQITDAGLDRYLIQARDGNRGAVGRAVHLAIVLRGFLIGGAIALSAPLVASFFHHPELAKGLRLLALAPVIGGFVHLDYRRVQRHHQFGLEGRMMTAGELASLVALVAAALVLQSHLAIAVALIARAVVQVIVSHRIAHRPYRLGLPGAHRRAMIAFSLPLLLNGGLFFFGGQGDRLLIGSQMGPTDLGHYSAVMLLVFYPTTLLNRQIASIYLPIIAATRNDPAARARQIATIGGQAVVIAIIIAAGFALVAPMAVPIIYGPRFGVAALLVALIAILQAVRFVRLWPTTVSLATGHSGNLLVNSIVRLSAYPMALVLAAQWGLKGILVGFIAGEFFAFGASMLLLHRNRLGRRTQDWSRIALLAIALAALAFTVAGLTGSGGAWLAAGLVLDAVAIAWLATRERPALALLFRFLADRAAPVLRRLKVTRS